MNAVADRPGSLMAKLKAECPKGAVVAPPLEFQLAEGVHIDNDIRTGKERMWVFNELGNNVVETYKQLDSLNVPGYAPKFILISKHQASPVVDSMAPLSGETKEAYRARMDAMIEQRAKDAFEASEVVAATPATAPAPRRALDQMSEQELRALAAEDEVDVSKARNRADVLRVLQQAKRG